MRNDYNIYIPSKGRAQRQITLSGLPLPLLRRTVVVVDDDEHTQYRKAIRADVNVIATPAGTRGIHKVRQWIAKVCTTPKLVMVDDDLRFYRRLPGVITLRKVEGDELVEMFDMLSEWLDDTAHAAISPREGNFHKNRLGHHIPCGRALRCLAFRTKEYRELAADARLTVMEDFDTALRLLRAGWANKISCDWVHNQDGGSNTPGGCSSYRTAKVQADAARQLAKLHPGFVNLRTKKTKQSWNAGERIDVIVAWKKAWLSGLPEILGGTMPDPTPRWLMLHRESGDNYFETHDLEDYNQMVGGGEVEDVTGLADHEAAFKQQQVEELL